MKKDCKKLAKFKSEADAERARKGLPPFVPRAPRRSAGCLDPESAMADWLEDVQGITGDDEDIDVLTPDRELHFKEFGDFEDYESESEGDSNDGDDYDEVDGDKNNMIGINVVGAQEELRPAIEDGWSTPVQRRVRMKWL